MESILREIQTDPNSNPFYNARREYINKLFKKRKRNVITYYSGWLQKQNIRGTEINDDDKNSFMSVIHKLDRKKGLDLIIHTPGGEVAATESLIDYLTKMLSLPTKPS